MGYINVTFLGETYSIPEDVLIYVDLLGFADKCQKQLADFFLHKLKAEIRKGNTGLLGDEDLTSEIEQQVGKFIAKLCDNGIYNRTIRDYLNNNKGYQYISDVNKAALEKIKSLLMRRLDSLQEGYEDAIHRAESHVTGMGFSILSGSFVNHAIYAAMEASTINKQEKEASARYQKEMSDLCSKLESDYDKETSLYINNEYIPNMEAAFTVFAYELLDKYVADLVSNGKFDAKAMEYVDISRSNDLLKNLTLSSNKKAVIENAFAACPYNTAVYMQAMKHELMDFDTFQTAKTFKQSSTILSFLQDSWGKVSYPDKFEINYYGANVLASLTGQPLESFLRVQTESFVGGIITAYAKINELVKDEDWCRKVIKKCNEQSVLAGDGICKNRARAYVTPIVAEPIWRQLTEQCGHTDLLDRIKKYIPQDITINTKQEVDNYFVNLLYRAYESARADLVEEFTQKQKEAERRRKVEQQRKLDEQRKKQEEQRLREEKRKRRKYAGKRAFKVILKVAVALVVVVVLYFAGLFFNETVIDPAKQYKSAIALMESGDYQSARTILISLDGYKESDALIEQCNAADIEASYNAAIQLMAEQKYIDAATLFRTLDGYKDSEVLIEECQTAYRENEYNKALQLMHDGMYQEAIQVFIILGDYNDSADRIVECEEKTIDNQYIYAIELANAGSYDEAIGILEGMGDYRDAIEIINKCRLRGCKVGDEIIYGTYEQDGNLSNGTEDIEWIVLDRDGNKILVLTKYCIEQMPFNDDLAPVTWAECSIRNWLNGYFWGVAFTNTEKSQIMLSRIAYPDDAEKKCIEGETMDWMFLLSENEAQNYLDSYASRKASATEYVSTSHCYWILRTHGSVSNVAHVDYKGYLGYYENVDRNWWIRPAMWIEIDDTDFKVEPVAAEQIQYHSPENVAPADAQETAADDFVYVIRSDGTIEIAEYLGNGAYVNIPTEIDGYTVSSIGERAFRYCESIQSIAIPPTVTNIGEYAFADCSVKSVSIDGCSQIAAYAFYDCEDLEKLVITDGVTSIGQSSFRYCGNVESLVIPSSVTSIGEYAFADSGVLSVHLDGCSSISDYAFYDCEKLRELVISDGVKSIGQSAFRYAGNIESLTIPESVTNIGDYAFADSGIIALHLDGCPSIPDYAFYDCENLTTLTISEGVKDIGQSAFRYCGDVETLTIPSSVTNMGEYVFADSGIKELYLDGCPRVPAYAFYDCEKLKKLVICGDVKSIGQSAFRYCSSLETLTIENSNINIGEYAFDNCDFLQYNF